MTKPILKKEDIDLSAYLIKGRQVDDGNNNINDSTILLPFCVYNASGPRCGTIEALIKIKESVSGAIVTKSSTLISQNGNVHPRTYHTKDQYESFNSEGLPNQGIDYYINEDNMNRIIGEEQRELKSYIVSLSGKTLDDNIEMLRRISIVMINARKNNNKRCMISSIELNIACPNIIGKPIIGYDYEQMELIFQTINQLDYINDLPPIGIKLPPYFDFQHYNIVCSIINKYKNIIRYVVSINTVGNCTVIDHDNNMPCISSNNGYAGLSGSCIKYIALANVRKLRELLHVDISIIGVGGISTGYDVYEMLLCGANACQIATTFWKEGSTSFERIQNELYNIMIDKGYKSIQNDVINQLQLYHKIEKNIISDTNIRNNTTNKPIATINSEKEKEILFYKTLSIVLIIIIAVLLHPYFMG